MAIPYRDSINEKMNSYYNRNFHFFKQVNTIFMYAVDPGAFSVLSLFANLLQSKKHRLIFVLDGWARANESTRYPKALRMNREEFVQSQPEGKALLIYGAQTLFSKNYRIVDQCRHKNVDTLLIFDHWKNCLINFRDPETGTLHLPSRVAVIDEYHRECLRKELSPFVAEYFFDSVDVFGQPAISHSVEVIRSLSGASIASLLKKFNPQKKSLALLILEPIRDDFGKDSFPGYDEFTISEFFFAFCCTNGMRVLIKPHPRHNPDHIRTFFATKINSSDFDYTVVTDEKVEHLIAIADEIYGMTSIAMMAALYAGKQITSLQINRNRFGRTLSNPYLEPHTITSSFSA